MQIATCSVRCLSASDFDRTLDSPLGTADATASRSLFDHEMALNFCDVIRWALHRGGSRRIARHKDQKSFRAIANTDSQTSKEESDTHSIANARTKTKESFADSISESDTEDEIKAQESISYTHTERISRCNGDTVAQCGRNACSREEGLAQRESFP
jgi:hypothetical protein